MNLQRAKDFAIGLGFVIIQIVLFRHLKFYGMQPDLVLVYLLFIMTRRDRTTSIMMAGGLGFIQDAFLDMWGLNMFAKTLLAFGGYRFIPRSAESRLLLGQVFLLTVGAALIHNIIFLGLSGLIGSYSTELYFWRLWIGNSIYTGLVASFLYLFRTK